MQTTFDYCLKEKLLGVGWRILSIKCTSDWDEYYSSASETYDNLQICKYIYKWVKEDDLVWTRDPLGRYYLCRVLSGWEYYTTPQSNELDIDIANIFRCDIKEVDIDEVPGKVIACFRATRTIQSINNENACEYSKYLWNRLSNSELYSIQKALYSDIFMMLDDEETEDLVFLYLQKCGWYVIPHSRKGDSMSFEYLCVNPSTSEIAGIQVKTGNTVLDKNIYSQYTYKVFLFQANGLYSGANAKNVEIIPRSSLIRFMHESVTWLPKAFKRKLELIS